MPHQDLGPLLAIARAKFTVGLLLFTVALALLAWSATDRGRSAWEPQCGVVDRIVDPVPKRPVTPEFLAYLRGEKLFKTNCASCHKPDRNMTGPGLKGAKERWLKSGGDLHAWVKNSLGYLKSNPNDAYAHALFNAFNGAIMTPNALTDEEIDVILNYVDNFRYHAVPVIVP